MGRSDNRPTTSDFLEHRSEKLSQFASDTMHETIRSFSRGLLGSKSRLILLQFFLSHSAASRIYFGSFQSLRPSEDCLLLRTIALISCCSKRPHRLYQNILFGNCILFSLIILRWLFHSAILVCRVPHASAGPSCDSRTKKTAHNGRLPTVTANYTPRFKSRVDHFLRPVLPIWRHQLWHASLRL